MDFEFEEMVVASEECGYDSVLAIIEEEGGDVLEYMNLFDCGLFD